MTLRSSPGMVSRCAFVVMLALVFKTYILLALLKLTLGSTPNHLPFAASYGSGPGFHLCPCAFCHCRCPLLEEFEIWLETCSLYVFVMVTTRPLAMS